MKLSEKKIADLLLFVTASGWAMSTIIIKLYVDELPTFHIMFGRYLMAFLIMFAFQPKTMFKIKKSEWKPGILLGILTFIAFTLAILSLNYTSASKSGFLVAMSVLFVPIVTTFLRKQLPNKWTLISVLMSIVGLYFISGMNGGSFNKGDALAILCAASYTVYILLMDRYAKDIEDMKLVLMQLFVVTIISFVFMMFEGVELQVFMDGFIPLLLMALLGTAITNYAQTKAQKHATPESVGLILLGEPLFTLIFAFIILNETIYLSGLFGAALLLIALVLTVVKDI